jgi:hypothetical protein
VYKGKTHKGDHGRSGGRTKAVAAAVVIVIVALVAYYAIGQGVPQITQTQLVYVPVNQTSYFKIFGYLVAMRLQSSSNYSAVLYASRVPVLLGPVSAFSLATGASASVSSAGSQIADINVKLMSSSSKGASIDVTPLPSTLAVGTSSTVSVLNPAALGSASSANAVTVVPSLTTAVTTSATTTILNTGATLKQQAIGIANATQVGTLMKKYKALYNSDTACTASVYGATYSIYYGAMPTVPNDFANVSALTPTDIAVNATLVSGSRYNVTYSLVSGSPYTRGPAVVVTVDTSLSSAVGTAFAGMYRGLSYATINNTYTFQSGIVNRACAAFVLPH